MGGTCLGKQFPRITVERYHELTTQLSCHLQHYFNKVAFPTVFSDKDSFGDIDILVSTPFNSTWKQDLFKWLDIKLAKSNGNIHSFEFGQAQIDLILVPPEEFDFQLKYLSYGDMGNLIGRIARHKHYKFGGKGFFFPQNDKDVLISHDWNESINFLGWTTEFPGGTKKDMFDWIISSRFYNPAIYLFENRNYSGKHRDSKRQTYLDFLEYTKDHTGSPLVRPDKYECLNEALNKFPKFCRAFAKNLSDLAEAREISEKFNGNIVAEVTGLSGKELGDFIQYFMHSYCFNFMALVVETSKENMRAYILLAYTEWAKNYSRT